MGLLGLTDVPLFLGGADQGESTTCCDWAAVQGPNGLKCLSQEPATMLPPFPCPQSLASGKRWALAIALKHGHLGQKDRGSSHGPQASAHSLGAIHQAKGLVIQERLWTLCGVEGSRCRGAGAVRWPTAIQRPQGPGTETLGVPSPRWWGSG